MLFAARVTLWLCAVSWSLRRQSLSEVLRRISTSAITFPPSIPADRVIAVIDRVCAQRLFNLTWFPRPCLRRALAFYHYLGAMGQAVRLHVGVRKRGDNFTGHSWVTVAGRRIADGSTACNFQELFNYPPLEQGRRVSVDLHPGWGSEGGQTHET